MSQILIDAATMKFSRLLLDTNRHDMRNEKIVTESPESHRTRHKESETRRAKSKIDFDYLDGHHETTRRENSGQSARDAKGSARWKWHGSLGEVKVRYFARRRAVSRLNVVVHHKNAVVYRGQPRYHKIKLPDHARVRTGRTWRRHYKSYNFIVAERESALFCRVSVVVVVVAVIFFFSIATRRDATRRPVAPAFYFTYVRLPGPGLDASNA